MRMLCFSAALAAAFMIVAAPVSAATLERAGTVQRQKGEASRTHGDDSSPLKEGAAVYAGDIVETGAEARLLIRFADASTLQMGGGGKMEIDEMVYNVHGLSDAPDRQAVNFVAGRLTVGMPPGTSHYGYQIRDGAIEVIAPGGSVTLDAPGEGTFLPFDRVAAPTPVRQWTAEEAQEADDLLAF